MEPRSLTYSTSYHVPEVSPWPLVMGFSLFSFAVGLIRWLVPGADTNYSVFNIFENANMNILVNLVLIGLVLFQWFRDIVREGEGGHHTIRVQKGIELGFYLFLITEIMLFGGFFWAFFHSSLNPNVELGVSWPPVGLEPINTWSIPLLGSTVLLSGGFVLTLAHHSLVRGEKELTILNLGITVILSFFFVYLQYNEYSYAQFTISDSVFGSVFYLTTGLHAIHVIAGATFLAIMLIRIILDQVSTEHHLGYEFAIYYFHLVDVVWLFVFMVYYWWGGR